MRRCEKRGVRSIKTLENTYHEQMVNAAKEWLTKSNIIAIVKLQ